MLLSFHVKRTDLIQCYLYLGGEMIRFEGYHLKSILPIFFEQSEKNKCYVNSEELTKIVKYIDALSNDLLFEKLCNARKIDDSAITKDIENKLLTAEQVPFHRFTAADVGKHIEEWISNDIDYQKHLKLTKQIFEKNKLDGKKIQTYDTYDIRQMVE
eukprot:146204_1